MIEALQRIVWTSLFALITLLGGLGVVIFLPEHDTLALCLIGSSITFSVLSHREGR
jgi:hypothetical protein